MIVLNMFKETLVKIRLEQLKTLEKYKYTIRGFKAGISLTLGILLILGIGLVTQDLKKYKGTCPGSILPFIGEQKPYKCSLREYIYRNAQFSWEILIYYHWYWGVILVILPTTFGAIVDWRQQMSTDNDKKTK